MNRINGFFLVVLVVVFTASVFAQIPQLVSRTTTKTDRFDFGSGGTVAVTGAPAGSVKIVGWQKNEIEITAEITIQAPTEAGLNKLAEVTGFATDETVGRTGILSLGTNDKKSLKKSGKKIPKDLLGLPFTINYVISVPHYTDLEIDGGKGDLWVENVEGSMRINFIETNAKIEIIGGITIATIGKGTVDLGLGTRGWRARSANIQLGTGDMTVRLPPNLNGEIDATVLRTGKIENTFPDLKPRDRKIPFTDTSILAKVGAGGVSLKFSVGDGTLKMSKLMMPF